MKRAAIYARFSSDRQNERSCTDQIALCTTWAERHGFTVVATFEDRATSGASAVNRRGLAGLMRAARRGQFDVVIAEDMDRISRSQADTHKFRDDLQFLEIGLYTAADGEITAMQAGVKGLLSELYLVNLAQKTKRGQSARVREGKIAGGRSYGYEPVAGQPGTVRVNEREAAVIEWIFRAYVAGSTPRQIVTKLNSDGVPSPRGGKWNSSTINGSRKRQNGIIQNRLYVGEIVWNRQRFIKNPETGKRISRPNDESEFITTSAPDLAVIDRELFDAAQRIKERKGGAHAEASVKPKHFLSGLLKCGCCGASYTIIGRDRLGCAGYRERGDCDNNRSVERRHIEQRVVTAMRTRLADPMFIAAYVQEFHNERRRLARQARDNRAELQRRLEELTNGIERIVDRIVDGTAADALVKRLQEMEEEKKRIVAELATIDADENVVDLHPAAAQRYRQIVEELQAVLQTEDEGNRDELYAQARKLITQITVHPTGRKAPVRLEVTGVFDQLLRASEGEPLIQGGVGCGSTQQPLPYIRFSA